MTCWRKTNVRNENAQRNRAIVFVKPMDKGTLIPKLRNVPKISELDISNKVAPRLLRQIGVVTERDRYRRRLGRLDGITSKAAYSNVITKN